MDGFFNIMEEIFCNFTDLCFHTGYNIREKRAMAKAALQEIASKPAAAAATQKMQLAA